MKAYTIGAQDGLSSLSLGERPDPVAGPGDVVIKVRLASLNNRDIQILEGRYGAKKAEDRIPLGEGMGEVVAVGADVTGVTVGDRAICAHFLSWLGGSFDMSYFAKDLGTLTDGWAAEYIKVPANAVVKVPDAVADEAAAALAAATVTAWHAIVEFGQVKAGDLVLALGTGGVSMAALQIAKANGALFAVTSSSDEKLEEARKMGADFTVNYRTHPDWAAELLKQTGGRGADIIAETGGLHTLPHSVAAAGVNGRISLIGVGFADAPIPYGSIIGKNLVIKGLTSGSREMLVNLLRAMDANGFAPVIDKTFAFDEMDKAFDYLKSGSHQGKVLVRVA